MPKKRNLNIPNSLASSSSDKSLFSSKLPNPRLINSRPDRGPAKLLILFYKFVKNIDFRLLTSRVR